MTDSEFHRASPPPPQLAALLAARDAADQERAWSGFLKAYSRLILHAAQLQGSGYDAMMDRYAFAIEQLKQDDFRRLRSFAADGRGKFTTWLTVVVRRLGLDHDRQRYGRARSGSDEAGMSRTTRRRLVDLVAEQVDIEQVEGPKSQSPEGTVEAGELARVLDACLSALPARDRLLLALRFSDGLPAREIANVMGFPTLFHVYRRLNAVLASLRAELRKKGIDGSSP